jgi:hypothetical protein
MPGILATQEAETGKIIVSSQRGQKVSKTPFPPISWVSWLTFVIPSTWGGIGRRIIVPGWP